LAPFGTEVLNGIQLALERLKDGGDSPSIGLIVKDTESDRAAFLDELSNVLSDDQPLAVIGPLLSKNLPVMAEMAERTHIPLITPSATVPNLRRFGTYVFSTALTYGHQAKRVAEYALKEQQFKRFAILYPDTPYGRDLARLFAQELRQQDGELIASEPYKEGDNDFRAVIGKLKAEDLKQYGVEVQVDNDPAKTGIRQGGKKGKRLLYSPGFDAVFIPDVRWMWDCWPLNWRFTISRCRFSGPTDGTNLTLRASPIEASREVSLSTGFLPRAAVLSCRNLWNAIASDFRPRPRCLPLKVMMPHD
jgi:branched-chain amino acid transport system substrate-binding protein